MVEGPNAVSVDAAPYAENTHRPKGKKSKHDKKDRPVLAVDGGKKETRDRKGRRGKKSKKEKTAKAVEAPDQDRETKRNKSRDKKHKPTTVSGLRPLRKVQVLLIENGQPHAHFDGELGVLELVLPKKADAEDSVV